MLLPEEDADLYAAHLARFERDLAPANEAERKLVRKMADAQWSISRIPSQEMSIYSAGRIRYSRYFAQVDSEVRNSMLDAFTFQHHLKQLQALSDGELRLRREYERASAELKRLQSKRNY